ncbi:MAG TPA: glycosyltransferase [Rhodopila sp.]|uniref:glycosyltransferase n=1 Tax=Rhodopila sp. TaxID=2480087 RepID=UPI002D14BC4D|nr:glycosyltransferase [Rhodopila sp.]HVY17583.1 glycosyltransferase [Rhodopila sp.]
MTVLAFLSLAIWVYLLLLHGRFWQAGPVLPLTEPRSLPRVAIVVPARNEAPVIERSLRSLLAQDYRGPFQVFLVDDDSDDGTGDRARAIGDPRLVVVSGAPRPAGWSGKLWAVSQGVAQAMAQPAEAEILLLTDADIIHDPPHLAALVAQLERGHLDMVSEMVALACDSWAERALVPAFVFFFQLLYPFAWVNDGLKSTAAAAGGTILIRADALRRIGGIERLKAALIDDVALAAAVKQGGRIWLGHASAARSVRPYPTVGDIWRMITRTAFVQLRFSWLLLVLTTLGMVVTWLVPPFAAIAGHGAARWYGATAWLMLACSYVPTLRRFGRSPLWAIALPLVALFYAAATIGSAIDHYAGRGVAWKGRAYRGQHG